MEERDVKAEATRPHLAGRYAIRRQLGRGMMGVVYEAEDSVLGRTVAVKMIDLAFEVTPGAREDFEQRFFTEARVAAKLSHPGIVVCHDVGKDPQSGQLFIVFEHLKGHTLAERVAAGAALPWREAVTIVAKVARAIHHAHAHGVVHRDLKPANIMLLDPGPVPARRESDLAAKIMDFGVAKVESSLVKITATGQSFGSPLYMSPEQALGGISDARSDIFALGSVLSTLILGRPCFDAPNIPRILGRVIREEPPPISESAPDVPRGLDRVVSRALAKRTDDRYPTAEQMADDLDDVLAGREPRHLAGWVPPPPGTLPDVDHDALLAGMTPLPGTVALSGVHTGTVDLASLIDDPAVDATDVPAGASESAAVASPVAAPSMRTRALAAVLVVVTLLGGAILILRGQSAPIDPPPVATPTALPTLAPAAPTAEATAAEAPTPASTAEPTRAIAAAPARAAAPIETVDTRAVVRATERPRSPKSQLRLQIEHGLKDGSVNVWLDGALVFDARLRAQVERKVLAITVREGRVDKTLDIDPGRHQVRVEIGWDGNRRVKETLFEITPESAGVLEIRLGGMGKELDLEWKPTDTPR